MWKPKEVNTRKTVEDEFKNPDVGPTQESAMENKKKIDNAEVRHLETLDERAGGLSGIIRYLRNAYPETRTTPVILEDWWRTKPSKIRKELTAALTSGLVTKKAGTQHGGINTDVWQYRPTTAETPWKPEYRWESIKSRDGR